MVKIQTRMINFLKKHSEKWPSKDFLNNYLPERIMNIINVDTLESQKERVKVV